MLFPFKMDLFLIAPSGTVSWLGWGILFVGLLVAVIAARKKFPLFRPRHHQWILLGGLFLAVLLVTPFMGIKLPAIPVPGLESVGKPVLVSDPALMFLGAVPWMVCSGLLGIVPSVFLGGVSGLILAFLNTHDPFTFLELVCLSLIFSLSIQQRYRTLFFQLIRHPFFAAVLSSVACVPIVGYSIFMMASGDFVDRMSFMTGHLSGSLPGLMGTILLGGLITEGIAHFLKSSWGGIDPLHPSPAESSLHFRMISFSLAGALIFLIIFSVADWMISSNIARTIVKNQLMTAAQYTSENISFFQDTGQTLISQLASGRQLTSASGADLNAWLDNNLRTYSYFSQFILFDRDLNIIASAPAQSAQGFLLNQDERSFLAKALSGAKNQVFAEVSQGAGESTKVIFLASIPGQSGERTQVLWGQTNLATNPVMIPATQAIENLSSNQIAGVLVDQTGTILYKPISSLFVPSLSATSPTQPSFYTEKGADGSQYFVYYQPASTGNWAIILSIPVLRINQMALEIGMPSLGLFSIIILIALVSLSIGFGKTTRTLAHLTNKAQLITQGKLDQSFTPVQTFDEVGRLSDSFEQMRLSLTARVEELNRLLQVSQGVASSLVISDAIYPILEAAFNPQACLASVILADGEDSGSEVGTPHQLSLGPASQLYEFLNREILKLTQQRGLIVLNNLTRGRALDLTPHTPHPGSLIAVALRHEARFYGALWVAYDNPRIFTKEEISFLDTLAGEAALAAANAQLYSSAEIGRQRLEAIIASTPDPVLVTDQQGYLLLSNPAAAQLPGLGDLSRMGRPVHEIIFQNDLLGMLTSAGAGSLSREIVFPDGRTFHTSVSTVQVDNRMLGKVCMLRDITHYKELDNQKSEFVAMVSHDLRFPLTLIRGYSTMLPMVGDLNEQQKGYIRKMDTEVENISRLVNNVLDLGRIEAGSGLRISKVSAREIGDYVVSSLQAHANQKSIQLNLEIPFDSHLDLEADSALVQEALYNLVENAIKFTPVRGRVSVAIEGLPASILFSVHDTGAGIAPIDQPRMFEKFYRGGQRDANPISGSGLGLAIVKSIAERHGGKVWLESVLGKGSVFFLEIPKRPIK